MVFAGGGPSILFRVQGLNYFLHGSIYSIFKVETLLAIKRPFQII